jgi:hypothetical protein
MSISQSGQNHSSFSGDLKKNQVLTKKKTVKPHQWPYRIMQWLLL